MNITTFSFSLMIIIGLVCIPVWMSYDVTQQHVRNGIYARCMTHNGTKTVIDAKIVCNEIVYGGQNDKK